MVEHGMGANGDCVMEPSSVTDLSGGEPETHALSYEDSK